MNRLTKDDVKQMGMLELSHNQVFVKNREAWYRDFETEITARDLARAMFARNGIECPSDNEEFDEYMLELLQDGYETIDGMIALYYNALWAFAGVREKLKAYEDAGLEPEEIKQLDASDTSKEESIIRYYNEIRKYRDELKHYEDLEEQGLLIKLPCKVGDTVYINIQKKTYECKISGFYIIEDEIQFMVAFPDEDGATWFEVGETHKKEDLFLTREEAEKALEDK